MFRNKIHVRLVFGGILVIIMAAYTKFIVLTVCMGIKLYEAG